ncbi:MAG: CoA transferase [Gammaproteobacteria bacterium]|nr:CoA transferase [Gammaproteobacteria bacterium]
MPGYAQIRVGGHHQKTGRRHRCADRKLFARRYRGYGPGLGCGERHQSAIDFCSISAFGQTGPLSHLPGFDYMGQAYAGVTSLMGYPQEAPIMPAISIGDVNTGVHALAAINGALFYRSQGGGGQYIDCSLLDSYSLAT